MMSSFGVLMALTYLFVVLILFCIGLIVFYKYRLKRRRLREIMMTRILIDSFATEVQADIRRLIKQQPKKFLQLLLELNQTQKLHTERVAQLTTLICETGLDEYYRKRLRSWSSYRRMDAAVHLAILPAEKNQLALEQALARESMVQVKLHMCASLVATGDHKAIPVMVASLLDAPQWYRTRVNYLLASFGKYFHDYLPQIIHRVEPEIQSLLIDFASVYPAEDLKQYLLDKARGQEMDFAYRSVRILGNFYYHELIANDFILHPDPILRNIAILALDKIPTKQTIEALTPLLADSKSAEPCITVISHILKKEPHFLPWLVDLFHTHENEKVRQGLAQILSNRIEYLLMQLIIGNDSKIQPLLIEMIRMGKINGIIGFLIKNKTIEVENAVLAILRPLLQEFDTLRTEIQLYLPERLLKKMNAKSFSHLPSVRDHATEPGKLLRLRLLLPIVLGTVPLLHIIRYWHSMTDWSLYQHLVQYVLDFNYLIAWYSLAVNGSYLVLLGFSLLAISNQAKFWRLKKNAFLFRPRILPSISIIAPAYQEEASILESINSLLNLNYPNYDVLVVNDGSTDNTLQQLIDHYQLEKMDRFFPRRLKTKPIRGVYANPHFPKLLVIDKVGGGKADALNVGINFSQKEFVCGIDSDSLLEKDSLIKMASMLLDSAHEPVALGGNIFPVNGCTVNKGTLTSINIPQTHIARFQTIEYLRAFMAGRLGWAKLRSLLIISGAFGLFCKDRVVEIGGYLTSSERFKKDTVGEDMELVVRLNRHMLEKKLPFSVLYAFNANCWTEVPESWNVLSRQRDRWQRGLIDILYFHRTMLFNPRYGRIGMFSMPYFFVFELVGPFIEIQGYIMVILALFLGILDVNLMLFLFISTILLGILVSIFALAIAGKENDAFPGPYIIVMLLYALFENFGIRQAISFWRIRGYFTSLQQTAAWGKMTRQGFRQQSDDAITSSVQ